jgi:hypothetical protein
MDEMTTAYINPEVLAWALQRCGQTPDQLATTALTAENIRAWMKGERRPTDVQAEALGKKVAPSVPSPIPRFAP